MIIALEEARHKLIDMRKDVKELGNALRIGDLKSRAAELEAQTLDPNFWSDPDSANKITQEIKQSQDTIEE
jgi:peptide chain release factor 2